MLKNIFDQSNMAKLFLFSKKQGFTYLCNNLFILSSFLIFQELWEQIKSSSSEDSKLQGMVESLEKMLHDTESKYQVRWLLLFFLKHLNWQES